jgi:C-terminal processing protease CtpA/Prc
MSAEARAYLDEILETMQEHALNTSQVDWEKVRAKTYARAANAVAPKDTYPAIEFALGSLQDSHSRLMTPEEVAALESGALMQDMPEPSGELLDNGLAYLNVPAFAGSVEAGRAYAATLQGLIRELDAAQPCGWIVDLRENMGGDFWPMLAGIGLLVGEGSSGAFVAADGQEKPWGYAVGKAWEGDEALIELGPDQVYTLQETLPPVAVLTGRQTMSSGEAVVVTFRGRPNSRSFGQETAGLSTGNEVFDLADGARLFLTVSRFADRTGAVYGGIITPDEYVRDPESNAALEAAAGWLLEQPDCMLSSGP